MKINLNIFSPPKNTVVKINLNIFSPQKIRWWKYIQIYFSPQNTVVKINLNIFSPPPPKKKIGWGKIFKYFLFHTWSIVHFEFMSWWILHALLKDRGIYGVHVSEAQRIALYTKMMILRLRRRNVHLIAISSIIFVFGCSIIAYTGFFKKQHHGSEVRTRGI